MSITTTALLPNSIVTRYSSQYQIISLKNPGVWAQQVDWQPPIPEDGGTGGVQDIPIYGESDLVESALAEDTDVMPDSLSDSNMTITPTEWGKTWGITKKARYQSRTKLPEIMGKVVAMNRINSIDRILRRGACGYGSTMPAMVRHVDDSGTMVLLTAASSTDTVTWAWLMNLAAYAETMGVEPFDDGGFRCIIHPLLALDIQQLTEWRSIGYYQDKANIYNPGSKPFTMGNITFIPNNMGRLYLGSGTVYGNRTNTTLAAAYDRGTDTGQKYKTIVLTSAGTVAVGDYITLGTVETESVSPSANLEQVRVIYVNSTTLRVVGNGVGNSLGLRFDHAALEPVTFAYNVGAIPLIGKNSLLGVYGTDCGKYGQEIIKKGGLDLLDRFTYYGWYWYGGLGVVDKRVILGKAAVSSFMQGFN